jgi:integrase/recombinase XerD
MAPSPRRLSAMPAAHRRQPRAPTRALGYKITVEANAGTGNPTSSRRFREFLEQREATVITTELALAWATQPVDGSVVWWHQRLAVERGFARYLQASDPRTEVPPADLLPAKFRRAVPYLYSDAEIEALMSAAREIRSSLKAATYETDRAAVDRHARRRGDHA